LAERGAAILVISSELPEVISLSDRIVVLRNGRVAGELARREATENAVLRLMAGIGEGRRGGAADTTDGQRAKTSADSLDG
jgi:ABC-type multidrug transport system ATPase subunit